jgi:acetoin utilization deacetylase AcuC-like enzyme
MRTAYITHADCLKHQMGSHHPECPERISAIESYLQQQNILPKLIAYSAPKARPTQLARVHSQDYIDQLALLSPKDGLIHLDADTAMNPYTLDAALRAAGAAVLATDLVCQAKVDNAFCNIRPPGHHAEYDHAMGFCIFNNVLVGALHAQQHYALSKVAIVDFDVHHGNGTQHILEKHRNILYCSTFQHPFYPFSGAEDKQDYLVNVPLAAGSDGQVFREAVTQHWLPALTEFAPDIIYISAGFDAHQDDEMAELNLLDADFAWVTEQVLHLAKQCAQGRIISVLEGGYCLPALASSVAAHIKVLLNS